MNIEVKFNNNDFKFFINEKALTNNVKVVIQNTPLFEVKKITITFTTQMLEDIENFQRLNGWRRIGMSKGAIGKAFTIADGEHHVFLKFDNFRRLAEYDYIEDERVLTELHYLHHEIAHLYDGSVTIEILPETFYGMENLTYKERFLYEIAMITWCEYKANFISVTTLNTVNFENYCTGLINCFGNMEERVKMAKVEIEVDSSNCLEIQYLIKDLFYSLGQIIGLMQGSESDKFREELKLLLLKTEEEYGNLDIVQALINSIKIIDSNYRSWENYEVLKPINKVIEKFLKSKNIEVTNDLLFNSIN
ncbi:hypothetical protein [Lysinibacillus sp. 3P01SB]|uniref:hypothetical protein n=1 Tax=Lysinibacillus sp. 3P01SB TaxID=3132284 RepID=UPI0039A71277